MKFYIAAFVLLVSAAFTFPKREKTFFQDVATIHDSKYGLPEGTINRIQIINAVPTAQSKDSFVEFNGTRWIASKNKIEAEHLPEKNLPAGVGKVLSAISYQGKQWVGTEK